MEDALGTGVTTTLESIDLGTEQDTGIAIPLGATLFCRETAFFSSV